MPKKPENLTSHGPPVGAPVFHNIPGEIMQVVDTGDKHFVTVYYEDSDEPGKLNPVIMDRKDYLDLLHSQARGL